MNPSETKKHILKAIDSFKDYRIAVIGDIMLDEYLFGSTERLSPEAPIPIVKINKTNYILGGAANVANNIVKLGGKCHLIGIIGNDLYGKQIKRLLNESNINSDNVINNKKSTTVKTRVIGHRNNFQQIVRIDREDCNGLTTTERQKIIKYLEKNMRTFDCIILSDYDKGLFSKYIIEKIIKTADKNRKLIIGDIKGSNVLHYKGIDLITPNTKEAFEMTNEKDINKAAKIIQNKIAKKVILTQGANGMTIYDNNSKFHLPANKLEIFDVSGAGDTVIATLALGLCAGLNLKESAIAANYAAGVSVSKAGTATVNPDELISSIINEQ